MKVKDLTLFQWNVRLEQYRRENWDAKPGAAMRIDGTQLSVGAMCGGFIYNGEKYTCFYFADGAVIGVRHDFLMWLTKKLKVESNDTNS